MPAVTIYDNSLSKNITLEAVDAANAVNKTPSRYSYVTTNPLATSALTLTGSPFVYTNQTGGKVEVLHQGGTVSKIEHGRSGAFVDVGVTSGPLLLAPLDQVRVTYSVAPTMTVVPVP